MKLSEFKSRLKKQGVSYELFYERARYNEYNEHNEGDVEEIIEEEEDFWGIIACALDWRDTPEGAPFWSNVAEEESR